MCIGLCQHDGYQEFGFDLVSIKKLQKQEAVSVAWQLYVLAHMKLTVVATRGGGKML